MKEFKIQKLASLREQMKAVSRGERKAPRDAGQASLIPWRRWRGC